MTVSYLPSGEFSLERLDSLWAMNRPGVFWRHDVDHDLNCALAMALREAKAGISATYYIWPGSPDYDYRARDSQWLLQRIVSYGHRLGTHVDDPMACEAEVACLRNWPVGGRVSLHRPRPEWLWREIPGFEHALDERWQGRYVSDSRRRFRHSPEELLQAGGPVQVNLHPEWWFLPRDQAEKLRRSHEAQASHYRSRLTFP